MKKSFLIVFLATMTLTGCQWFAHKHQAGTAVELNGHYLFRSTLDSLTLGLTGEDSARVSEQYIRQWAKDILLYDAAKAHADPHIEALVEDYRRSLYVHAYEEYLVRLRMPKTLSDSAVQAVYQAFPERFRLDESLVKGIFMVVPSKAPNLNKLRQWLQQPDGKNRDEIEKYAYRYASGYELFTDRWLTLSTLLTQMPIDRSALETQLRQNNQIETNDSTNTYILRVTEKCLRGEAMPIDYARPEIESILLSGRQVEFLQKERERLYNEAVIQKKIQFYE